jgi:DNA-binding MarR family transcriptional regulator
LEVSDQGPANGAKPTIGTLLKRAEQSMVRVKTTALRPIGLTLAQYVALVELDRSPGVTAAALARACFVSPQAMMVLSAAMEQQGLIARQPHPRHANVNEIFMTPAGRGRLSAARVRIENIEGQVLATYSDTDLEQFAEFLMRFTHAFETAEDTAAVLRTEE